MVVVHYTGLTPIRMMDVIVNIVLHTICYFINDA